MLSRLVRQQAEGFSHGLYAFFFEEVSSRVVAIFRIVFGCVVLLNELLVSTHLKQLYTDQGYFSNALVHANTQPWAFSLLFYFNSPAAVYFFYAILILATLAFIFGFKSRIMALIMFVIVLSFEQRAILVTYGADRIIRIVLFYCIFLDADRALVVPWLRKFSQPALTVAGWPVRLIQLQIAYIYAFTADLKMTGSSQWNDGSFVYSLLNNPNYSLIDLHLFASMPVIMNLVNYYVLFTELAFPFLVWFKKSRPWIVGALVFSHLSIMLITNVLYFSETMVACLILFMDESWLNPLVAWIGAGLAKINHLSVKPQLKPR